MTAQARLLGDRYEVGELLGYGGMAEVHRGRDLRLGRDVAIKLLRADLARDHTFQERFRREGQNAAALNHPAIVAVYDTGEEMATTGEKLPFIVMEYVNGRTLKEVLAAEGRLMPRRALEITADMCAALEFSHRHGIIHRDIKPGNVMLTQNGQVKVMDFGIARALASGATTMTQTSAVIGTAQYLSPEQARGESVDARSDVYAAGCVLFELLCGHPPFVGDSPVSVAYQHVREDPPTPSDINHDVPPDLDAIVLKALAKNPLNRYQSAQEMRADVLRAVSGRPVLATPVLRDDETVAMAPTTRATGGTRALPAGVAGPPPPRRTSSWVMAAIAGLGVLAVVALVVGLILTNTKDNTPVTQQATVPSIRGMTEPEAAKALGDLRLTLDPERVTRQNCNGTITEQDPSANTAVALNTAVKATICSAPATVPIPNLVGFTKAAADQRLKDLDLEAKFEDVDSSAPKDQVVKVPDQGKPVPPNTEVVVQISKNNMRPVPDVQGRTRADAEAELRRAGFTNISFVQGERVDSDEQPTVTDQTPAAGRAEKLSARITLTVTVPDEPVEESPTPTPTNSPSPTPSLTLGTGGLLD